MKRRTRNYAKRQLTWMRRLEGVRVFDVTDTPPSAVAADIEAALRDQEETADRDAPPPRG